jgi:hypothetical protein
LLGFPGAFRLNATAPWHACPACHLLVEAGQWDALSVGARLPHDQGAALWASFQAGRAGTPTPLHPQAPQDQDP